MPKGQKSEMIQKFYVETLKQIIDITEVTNNRRQQFDRASQISYSSDDICQIADVELL